MESTPSQVKQLLDEDSSSAREKRENIKNTWHETNWENKGRTQARERPTRTGRIQLGVSHTESRHEESRRQDKPRLTAGKGRRLRFVASYLG